MIDTDQLLYEYLTTSGTTLYESIADRAWCPDAKAGFRNDKKAIVYHLSGETTHGVATDSHTSYFVFKCYGGSNEYTDAKAVYRLLHDRLHGAHVQEVTEGNILTGEQITGGKYTDPDTGWPCYQVTYKIKTEG